MVLLIAVCWVNGAAVNCSLRKELVGNQDQKPRDTIAKYTRISLDPRQRVVTLTVKYRMDSLAPWRCLENARNRSLRLWVNELLVSLGLNSVFLSVALHSFCAYRSEWATVRRIESRPEDTNDSFTPKRGLRFRAIYACLLVTEMSSHSSRYLLFVVNCAVIIEPWEEGFRLWKRFTSCIERKQTYHLGINKQPRDLSAFF